MFIPNFGTYYSWMKRFNMASFGPDLSPSSWTTSLRLDGSNEHVNFGDNINFDGSTAFSVGGWFKADLASGTFVLLSKLKGSPNYNGWELNLNGGSGKPSLYLNNTLTSNQINVEGQTALSDNVWGHLILTYDGSKDVSGVNFYVNGVSSSKTTVTNNLSGSSDSTGINLHFNARSGSVFGSGDTYYKEIAIWTSRELTQDDVDEFYNSGDPVDSMKMTNPPNHRYLNDNGSDDATGGTGVINDSGSTGGVNGTPINTESGDLVADVP